ncbi:MAG: hypothetical protein U0939_12750 [Pirellulales bacterium]
MLAASRQVADSRATREGRSPAREGARYLSDEKADELLQHARKSVGTMRGTVAEQLVKIMVEELRHAQDKDSLERMLVQAYRDLPRGITTASSRSPESARRRPLF